MNLRDHLFERGPQILEAQAAEAELEPVPLVPDIVDEEVLWACTTCGACMQECPVDIEHVDTIVDLRRNLVMAESRFPAEAGALLRNLETAGNPWGMPQAQRADWAKGLDVRMIEEGRQSPEYLYWVGCAGAFDDRATSISKAVVRLLQRAGVSFAILGPRELCTGDPARRIGNEYLFQTMAEQNVQTLSGAGVTKVVANCPHCFNTLRNEYPDYGGRFEVIHHSQLFAQLVADGRLRPTGGSPPRSRTTTPATSGATTVSIAILARRWRRCRAFARWRCRVTGTERCAVGPEGPACGWRSASAGGSTRSAPTRPRRPAPTPSGSPAPTA